MVRSGRAGFQVRLLHPYRAAAHKDVSRAGIGSVVDPLGGAYFIEDLTTRTEEAVVEYLKRIEEMGGAIKAVESGFIQKEIQDAAYEYHQDVEAKRKLVVGVNSFIDQVEEDINVQRIDPKLEPKQVASLKAIRAERDQQNVDRLLLKLETAAAGSDNLVPIICEAVEAYASVGEITAALKKSFGKFRPMVTI